MEQQNIAPVDHGVLSATGSVVGGTVGGALSSVGKTALYTIGGFMLFGLLVGTGAVGGALALFGTGAGSVLSTVGYTLGFGAIGAAASVVFAPLAGLIGGSKGAEHAIGRVSAEKGASNVVQAQLEAYRAQAQAETLAASNDNNRYNFPPQGSALNPAGAVVNSMQADGRVNGMQLQRA
jgi:hypothetical protein